MAKNNEPLVEIRGLVTVSGPFGIGKSTFGWLASRDLNQIVYIDGMTSKERDVADLHNLKIVDKPDQKIEPGSYVDFAVMLQGKDDLEAFQIQKKVIESLPNGLAAVIVDDVFFTGAHAYVRKNPKEFREGGIHGADFDMKVGIEYSVVRKNLLPSLYTTLRTKADLVLFLSREKPARDENGNPIPGAVEPDADPSLSAASMLSIKLRHNTRTTEPTNIPVGLVTKNNRIIDSEARKAYAIFPKRIPQCDWSHIGEYLRNPVGKRSEREDEVPDEDELYEIRGMLSPSQRKQYEYSQQLMFAGLREKMETAVNELAEELGEIPLLAKRKRILNTLKGDYPGLTEDDVEAWVA